jgi:hypothetical protein
MSSDPITKDEVEDAVVDGVRRVLTTLGIDHENALEMQQDFAYLRRLRLGTGKVTGRVLWGGLSALGTALATAILLFFQSWSNGGS